MDNLKAEGLPEPIVRGLEVIVEMARKLTGKKASPPRRERIKQGFARTRSTESSPARKLIMISPELAMVDTNVLVYAYYEDVPQYPAGRP